jgi:hypothetical protein
MTVLYGLFALSAFFPFFTYAIYPIVLRFMREKEYKKDKIESPVSTIIIGSKETASRKKSNLQQCEYPDMEIILAENYNEGANKALGDILIFTDTFTNLDLAAIREIVKPFADDRVGCVVGQQTNLDGNSLFWKYENKVKELESRIGCVSGATASIFAVRKTAMPAVPVEVLNQPFYIATSITQAKKAVVYQPQAKTYERATEGTNFSKHVEDSAGYWQALRLFPKMLSPRYGAFVYIGHRVLKWFVWLNMITMLITSGLLGVFGSKTMGVIFGLQVLSYVLVVAFGNKRLNSVFGKLMSIGYYFLMLNMSYLIGMFR